MSAFVCSHETINTVVNAWSGYNFDTSVEELEQLGRELIQMNYDAVNLRYRTSETPMEKYRYRLRMDIPGIEMVKAIMCLLYQCREGDIDERPLFRRINKMLTARMYWLITELPEYKTARGWE